MPRKPKPSDKADSKDAGRGERLQKVLAAAGVGSRRDCEELIREGRVEVDRQTITELGTRVDPLRQEIRVDGEALRQPQRLYYAVNKPVGVVTTSHDPSGRTRVIDLVPTEERVFAVGRLDRSSDGLILVTNDGEFANRITHPRYGVEKTYLVRVAGAPNHQQLAKLKKGVHLAEGFAKAQSISVKKQHGQSTDLVIVLNEGRNREIRRILARVGHKVLTLKRIAVGPIKLADLGTGEWRRLMPAEVEALMAAAKEKRREAKKRQKGSGFRVQGAGEEATTRRVREGAPTLARNASEGKRRSADEEDEPEYIQKQALMAEPLSLEDLLRDDLDEGPIGLAGSGELSAASSDEFAQPGTGRGGVIDYQDETAASPPEGHGPRGARGKPVGGKRPTGHKPRGKLFGERPRGTKPFGKKPYGKQRRAAHARGEGRQPAGEQAELEALPRESYGKKRGGRRVYSPQHEGRGPAGETGGNFRFRPKGTGRVRKTSGGKPVGGRPGGGESTGGTQRGGKPLGKKKFGPKKPAAKKFGKAAGNKQGAKPFGKKFGKSGGKRKGRR
jgi:23S rRNA pseudouridine2605 synthase